MSEALVRVSNLKKAYTMGRTELRVLRGAALEVHPGEFVAVVGASGSGKSTLLHLIGLLDEPDAGSIVIAGREMTTLPARQRTKMRRKDIGFVFQFYHLLPELNVLENVLIARMTGVGTLGWLSRGGQARQEAADLLGELGLGGHLRHRPAELSGGERQRVAIARALINRPQLLLADEPTGNLDRKMGLEIMDILKRFNAEGGQTIIMVTHDLHLAEQAHRTLHLQDGKLG